MTNGVSGIATALQRPPGGVGGRAPDNRWGQGLLQNWTSPRCSPPSPNARGRSTTPPRSAPRSTRRSPSPTPRTGARCSWTSRWTASTTRPRSPWRETAPRPTAPPTPTRWPPSPACSARRGDRCWCTARTCGWTPNRPEAAEELGVPVSPTQGTRRAPAGPAARHPRPGLVGGADLVVVVGTRWTSGSTTACSAARWRPLARTAYHRLPPSSPRTSPWRGGLRRPVPSCAPWLSRPGPGPIAQWRTEVARRLPRPRRRPQALDSDASPSTRPGLRRTQLDPQYTRS